MAENGNGKARTYAMGVWAIVGPIVLALLLIFGQGYIRDIDADIGKKADKAVVAEQIKRLEDKIGQVKSDGDKRDIKLDKIIGILLEK